MVGVDVFDVPGAAQGFQPADVRADEGVRVALEPFDLWPGGFQMLARPVDAAVQRRHIADVRSAALGSTLAGTGSSDTIWPRLISSSLEASAVST